MEATGALFTVEGEARLEAALAETNAKTKEGGVYYIAHGKQLCRFWNGTPGSCRRGDACTFVHQQWRKSDRAGPPVCAFFLDGAPFPTNTLRLITVLGKCRYGQACRFSHSVTRHIQVTSPPRIDITAASPTTPSTSTPNAHVDWKQHARPRPLGTAPRDRRRRQPKLHSANPQNNSSSAPTTTSCEPKGE